jgi:hypothetical protein
MKNIFKVTAVAAFLLMGFMVCCAVAYDRGTKIAAWFSLIQRMCIRS